MSHSELYVASITPVTSSEDLNVEALGSHIQYLSSAGVDGVTLCGTTGEFTALSSTLRKKILHESILLNQGKLKVMSGVGGNTSSQARENYKIAEDAGVDSLLLLTPWFEKSDLSAVEKYVASICEISKLPIYLYHHPFRTHFDWPVAHIIDLYNRYSSKIVGVKDSSCDFNRLKSYHELMDDNFILFFECPDNFILSQNWGAKGCIDGLSNLIPEIGAQAMKGNKDAIEKYVAVRSVLSKSVNYIGMIKHGLEFLGFPVGKCFEPNAEIPIHEKQEIEHILTKIGVSAFERC